ncbi:hypothetical protein C2G38_2186020 [Gigaspora rosea]|uniref:Uncharacterized protein n=1 Tax=Gigaspora rosea TaxID=44941 RepID=A0A397V8E9_9GLOM|nr:hypothetical protein C2G38_2186020 [Gigaspora rosea]
MPIPSPINTHSDEDDSTNSVNLEQAQSAISPKIISDNNPEKVENTSDACQPTYMEPKSLEEKEINDFLYEKNKETNSPCNKILDTEAEEEPCVSELERDNENDEVDASQIVEQGLMQELSQNTRLMTVIKGQEEILCWYYYSLEFENKVKSLITDGNIKDKTARTKLYKEMKPFLPRVTDSNLRKKTQRARKILK